MTIKQLGGVFGRNPTFNDVTIEGELTFDGDIDINSDLKINGELEVSRTGDGSIVTLKKGTTEVGSIKTIYNRIYIGHDDAFLMFANDIDAIYPALSSGIANNGNISLGTNTARYNDLFLAGDVVLASGQGIDFSATAGTGTSELFDDYEEGTFNPTYTTGGTDFDSVTYAVRYGNYVKLGSLIFVTGFIRTSSITVGSASGSVRIGGLPFTRIGSMSPPGICHGGSWAGDVPRTCISFTDATLGLYYRTGGNTDDQAIQISDLDAAGNNDLYFACSFRESY